MTLVSELLQAIVRVDGEALMIHAGDKPYVVASSEHIDLANHGLTLDVVNGIVTQLLTIELQHLLDEFGAVRHELPPAKEFPGEAFTVEAARDGDDVRVEIRRRRIPDEDRIPDEFFTTAHPPPSESVSPPARLVPAIDGLEPTVGYDGDELPDEILGFDLPTGARHSSRFMEEADAPQGAAAAGSNDDLTLPDEADLFPAQAMSSILPDAIAASALDDGDEIALFAEERFVAVETETQQPARDLELPAAKSIWGAPPVEPSQVAAADEAQRERRAPAGAQHAAEEAAGDENDRRAVRPAPLKESRNKRGARKGR
jgi:hypothetical protein